MSLFPIFEEAKNNTDKKQLVPKEYNFDFETGKYKGGFVYGLDAIKIWITKALLTGRYNYEIYSLDYGSEIKDFIGQKYNKNYLKMEIKRYLTECLVVFPYVRNVTLNSVNFDNRTIKIDFMVQTDFGEASMNVQL